jgi:hypothetical protein
MVELYLHSSTRLHGVVLNYNFTFIFIVRSFALFLPEQRVVKKRVDSKTERLFVLERQPGKILILLSDTMGCSPVYLFAFS